MKIILDFDFLEKFFLDEDDSERHFYITRLLSSASCSSELILCFDYEEAFNDPNKRPIFRKISQKLPISDLSILDKAKKNEFHETDEANLFFLESNSFDYEQFGCFSMNNDSLEKADNLLRAEDIRISSTMRDWSFLNSYRIPCNSIVITDNYLLSNDENLENTISILKSLMPKKLSIDFHLTIIGYDAKKHFKKIEDSYSMLLKELSVFSYNVVLTIIREDHHGRLIHTNYTRFLTEKGFALFSNRKIKPKDETTLSVGSVFTFSINSDFARKAELKVCQQMNRTERMPDKLAGSRINRLLPN
jgi:hypothetical protein